MQTDQFIGTTLLYNADKRFGTVFNCAHQALPRDELQSGPVKTQLGLDVALEHKGNELARIANMKCKHQARHVRSDLRMRSCAGGVLWQHACAQRVLCCQQHRGHLAAPSRASQTYTKHRIQKRRTELAFLLARLQQCCVHVDLHEAASCVIASMSSWEN